MAEAETLRARGEAPAVRQALAKYREAESLFAAAGDRPGQARAIYGEGRAHDWLSEKRSALEAYLKALALFADTGDHTRDPLILIYAALDHDYLGERDKARARVTEAIAAAGNSTDSFTRAEVLTHAGQVYNDLGERQKALDAYGEALILQKAAGSTRGEATVLSGIGVVYYSMGDAPKALDHLKPALELFRAAQDQRDQAYTLTSIGAVYYSLDDFAQALSFLNQATPLWSQAGDRSGEAANLHNIAAAYERTGELQQSIECYNRALPLERAAGYKAGEANTLTNLGRLYASLGDLTAALDYDNQALTLHRSTGNRAGEATTLNNLGALYELQHDYRKALEYLQQTLPLRRALGDRLGEAYALDNMARSYSQLGDGARALENANQALAIAREAGNPRGEAVALNLLGWAYVATGQPREAIERHRQALPLFRASGERMGEAATLYSLARASSRAGELPEARHAVEEGIAILESLRTHVNVQELRSSYLASKHEYYDLDIDVLMRQQQTEAAFEVAERARARSLLDLLSESGVDIRQGVDAALLERESKLRGLLNAKADRQIEILRAKHTDAQAAKVAGEVTRLTTDYHAIEAEIRTASPHYAALTQPQPVTLRQIQQDVLDRDTLLVEYALGADRTYAWVVSRDSVAGFALPPASEVERAARRFHEAASSDDAAAYAAARALGQMILGPLSSALGSKRLAVVADGALEYVPFAALPSPGRADGRPLLADHEIVRLPSASALAMLRTETQGRKPAPKALAVLADPVFRKDDPRVHPDGATLSPGGGQRSAELNLPRLGSSRREAEAILALVPEKARKEAVDFDASLSTATAPELGQYRIVHFATHSLLDTEHPELSGIVLSLVNRQGQPRDGLLRLDQIYNLRWGSDLVVLSACQTALGKVMRGEGVTGLTRGFMYAGVPRVAASLWKVDDQATAGLMTDFYRSMLAPHGSPPAAALRAAQLRMLAQKKWQSAYYWAAFVLEGDWR